jgi:hypothetical protein
MISNTRREDKLSIFAVTSIKYSIEGNPIVIQLGFYKSILLNIASNDPLQPIQKFKETQQCGLILFWNLATSA